MITSACPPHPRLSGVGYTFRALRHRDFRLLWFSLGISAIGTWMQIVAQSLLVLKITHGSAFSLGSVSLAQALSFLLFSLLGGSVADRVDKRRLLLMTQALSATLAIILGLITLLGSVRLWMILALAFLNGTLLSFDQPCRGALIPTLVPREDLGNAISLQSMIFNGAATIGPAMAGFGVAKLGYAGNFFLNAASFIGVLISLLIMKLPPNTGHQQSTFRAIRTTLGTVRGDSVLPWVLSGYGAMLFMGPSVALMLSVYALKVLHIGPERLGLMFSAAGAGTIAGGLFMASLRRGTRLGAVYLGGLFIWFTALAILAITTHFWLALGVLLVFGMGQALTGTSTITLLQTRVPEHVRGRMMSLNTLLIMGIRPLGDFPAGALIAAVGISGAMGLSALLVAFYGFFLALRPSIRCA